MIFEISEAVGGVRRLQGCYRTDAPVRLVTKANSPLSDKS